MNIARLLVMLGFLCSILVDGAIALDLRQKRALERMGENSVVTSLHYHRADIDDLVNIIQVPFSNFDFIDTLYLRAPASNILKLAEHKGVRGVEIIDETIAQHVRNMLARLSLLYRYHRIGIFRFGALNVSIGPPTSLLATRTGQETIRRAYRAVVEGLDVPLITTAGNNGPMPGVFNSWAVTPNVIVAAAATSDGSSIGDFSGRPSQYGPSSKFHFFAAHGIDTIGPRAEGAPKSEAMREAESRVDLGAVVGLENVKQYQVDSGTSYAAANITRMLCFAHQMTHLLLSYADSRQSLSVHMPSFVRAYIDSGVDSNHPDFEYRLADRRLHFMGMQLSLDRDRKEQFFLTMINNGIDVRIEYSNTLAVRFLKAIAREVPGTSPVDSGHGFVSFDAAAVFVQEARFSSLIELFSDPDESRTDIWREVLADIGDPLVFSEEESAGIVEYCSNYDLFLMLPLLSN